MKPCQFRVWEGIIPLLKCTRNAIGVGRILSRHIYFVKEGVMLTIPLLKSISYLLILATSLKSLGFLKQLVSLMKNNKGSVIFPPHTPMKYGLPYSKSTSFYYPDLNEQSQNMNLFAVFMHKVRFCLLLGALKMHGKGL